MIVEHTCFCSDESVSSVYSARVGDDHLQTSGPSGRRQLDPSLWLDTPLTCAVQLQIYSCSLEGRCSLWFALGKLSTTAIC